MDAENKEAKGSPVKLELEGGLALACDIRVAPGGRSSV